MAHRAREPNLALDVVDLAGKVERSADVRKLGLDAVEPRGALQPEARLVALGELDAPGQLPATCHETGIVAVELLRRVRGNRLEQAEARVAAVAGRRRDQARVEQGVERARNVRSRLGDGLESLERRAAREGGERNQHLPGRLIQQVHTPLDGGAKRALALREVGSGPGQQRQRLPEPLGGALDPEDADTRRRQLDRQRKPVEGPGDSGDRADVRVGHREVGLGLAGAVDVEAHGGAGRNRIGVGLPHLGNRQRGNPVLALQREAERHAARGEDPKRRRCLEQLCEGGERVRKVLEVVDDDERLGPAGERVSERLERCFPLFLVDPQRRPDARQHQSRVGQRREVDERCASRLRRRRQREARLPRASGAREREQPDLRPLEKTGERGELEVAADQLGPRGESRIPGDRLPRDEFRVLLQDPALERSQLRGRLQAQLVQGSTGITVGGERVCLAPRPVEGEHALRLETLAVRVAREERVELAREGRVKPSLEVRVDTGLESGQPALLEPCSLGLGEGLVGDVREGRASPERESFPERIRFPGGREALEPLDVELVRLDVHVVAGRSGDDPVGAQSLAERVHVHLQRAGGALGMFAWMAWIVLASIVMLVARADD